MRPASFAFGYWERTSRTRGKIPGVDDVAAGITPSGTWYVFYTFASAEAFQKALGSPEAAYARGTWERWDDLMEVPRTIEGLGATRTILGWCATQLALRNAK